MNHKKRTSPVSRLTLVWTAPMTKNDDDDDWMGGNFFFLGMSEDELDESPKLVTRSLRHGNCLKERN